jgi:hypothetical protein
MRSARKSTRLCKRSSVASISSSLRATAPPTGERAALANKGLDCTGLYAGEIRRYAGEDSRLATSPPTGERKGLADEAPYGPSAGPGRYAGEVGLYEGEGKRRELTAQVLYGSSSGGTGLYAGEVGVYEGDPSPPATADTARALGGDESKKLAGRSKNPRLTRSPTRGLCAGKVGVEPTANRPRDAGVADLDLRDARRPLAASGVALASRSSAKRSSGTSGNIGPRPWNIGCLSKSSSGEAGVGTASMAVSSA